jgi:hypothetical protein
MHVLIAFALGPIGRYVVGGLAVMAVLAYLRWDIASDAVSAFQAKTIAAFQSLTKKADKAELDALNCRGTWNRSTGKCE